MVRRGRRARPTEAQVHLDADQLVALLLGLEPPTAMPTMIIAVDGGGGAGKSTLAASLAEALDSPIIPTDDFASWEQPLEWWPRMVAQVLEPLRRGDRARWQRYDWERRCLAEWRELPVRPPRVLLEGVTALRREFTPYISYGIWVETLAELRLDRGLRRDGDAMRSQWQEWMASEEAYRRRNRPDRRADAITRGW